MIKTNKVLYISHVQAGYLWKICCEKGNPIDWMINNCFEERVFLWEMNRVWAVRT